MKISLFFLLVGLIVTACHRDFGERYEFVPKHARSYGDNQSSVFRFNKVDSSYYHYPLYSGDTLFGSYSIMGNQLYLTELGKTFECNSNVNRDSTLFVFLFKFNSLPAVEYPVEINGQTYYTDSAGVLQNYSHNDFANYLFIKPVLMKSFRIPKGCTDAVFYMEPMYVTNPDFFEFTIRSKFIRSRDGLKYRKTKN